MSETLCPICELPGQNVTTRDYGERLSVNCRRCGTFEITKTAALTVKNSKSHAISAWIRDRNELGLDHPELNSDLIKDVISIAPEYHVAEKQLLALRAIERRTQYPGQNVILIPHLDYPLSWSENKNEFTYLIGSLIDRKFLLITNSERTDFCFEVSISPDGWNFLEEHSKSSVVSTQAFVAMSFDPALKPVWEDGIRPALKRSGFEGYRVDMQPHNDRIDVKIMSEIQKSRFLVADVTGQRPGVYFEAGYAIGLGIPVIWCVNNADLKNVHFDTRQYFHITWENSSELSERLYDSVSVIISERKHR